MPFFVIPTGTGYIRAHTMLNSEAPTLRSSRSPINRRASGGQVWKMLHIIHKDPTRNPTQRKRSTDRQRSPAAVRGKTPRHRRTCTISTPRPHQSEVTKEMAPIIMHPRCKPTTTRNPQTTHRRPLRLFCFLFSFLYGTTQTAASIARPHLYTPRG